MVATSDRRRRRRRFNDESAGILERWRGWFSGGKKRRKGHKCLGVVLMELVAVESVGTRRW